MPMAAEAAWQALEPLMPLQGKRLLIHGGAGGIGGFAVQVGEGLFSKLNSNSSCFKYNRWRFCLSATHWASSGGCLTSCGNKHSSIRSHSCCPHRCPSCADPPPTLPCCPLPAPHSDL